MQSPLRWPRGPRETFQLTRDQGVYALFVRDGASLPGITTGEAGLLYIGSAKGRRGLKGRCHFNASTANHSPRKSLAALLLKKLDLKPVLVVKPKAAATWKLDELSETRLNEWMHSNLHLAVAVCSNPDEIENELLLRFAPPLNLVGCKQTAQHIKISAARAAVQGALRA